MSEQTTTQSTVQGNQIGIVTSNKPDKTCVVEVERKVRHREYGKYIKRTTKLYVHDEKNECQTGDLVMVRQSRPLSKLKRWVLVKILEKSVTQRI